MSPSEDPENQLKNSYRFVWSDRPPGPGRFFQKKGYFVPHLLKGSPGHLGPARPPKTRIAYRDGGLPPSDLARANQFIIQARVYLEVQNLVCLFTKAARHIDLSCCPIRSNHGSFTYLCVLCGCLQMPAKKRTSPTSDIDVCQLLSVYCHRGDRSGHQASASWIG